MIFHIFICRHNTVWNNLLRIVEAPVKGYPLCQAKARSFQQGLNKVGIVLCTQQQTKICYKRTCQIEINFGLSSRTICNVNQKKHRSWEYRHRASYDHSSQWETVTDKQTWHSASQGSPYLHSHHLAIVCPHCHHTVHILLHTEKNANFVSKL